MFVRKSGNGEYYLSRVPLGISSRIGKREIRVYRNWWLVRNSSTKIGKCGIVYISGKPLVLPMEFIGKKIRLKIEIVEENNK